ncbi:unnamed protein product [Angiostrongylus costaricensis]|uniref:WD_REPEATS_REGION domain-containing protein n=1 Tax=Angiostrongylus costaricensis TaxID=334426 RepID=A0A0R3Q0H9_ANGCS|nr:unnamed protein product [Angiostrongylus costaricensis]
MMFNEIGCIAHPSGIDHRQEFYLLSLSRVLFFFFFCSLVINSSERLVSSSVQGNSGVRSICMLSGGTMVATGHSLGQVLIWDCREGSFLPSVVCIPSKRRLDAVTAITNHFAQANLLSFGTDHGVVGFCDVRGVSHDLITNSFDAATSTVGFHPECGNHLVCASADGSLVHWDVSAVNTMGHPAIQTKIKDKALGVNQSLRDAACIGLH